MPVTRSSRQECHLVTGGGGYAGYHVGKALIDEGHKVVLVDIHQTKYPMLEGMSFIQVFFTWLKYRQMLNYSGCLFPVCMYSICTTCACTKFIRVQWKPTFVGKTFTWQRKTHMNSDSIKGYKYWVNKVTLRQVQ